MKRYDPSEYQCIVEDGHVVAVDKMTVDQLQQLLCRAIDATEEMLNAALEGVAAADKWMNGGEDE